MCYFHTFTQPALITVNPFCSISTFIFHYSTSRLIFTSFCLGQKTWEYLHFFLLLIFHNIIYSVSIHFAARDRIHSSSWLNNITFADRMIYIWYDKICIDNATHSLITFSVFEKYSIVKDLLLLFPWNHFLSL